MLENKKDVYKPPAVIHHDNTNVSLIQKQAWSWLIANAYDDLEAEDTYSVRVRDLMHVMGYNSKNTEHLKDSLRNLMTTLVEWDIPGYDKKNDWQAATMLSGVRISDGVCYYGLDGMFRRALSHPEIYARLSLAIISQFSKKYALNLWEMCMHAMNPRTGVGETQWWELDEFRTMVGVREGLYKQFKDLKRRVIAPAIKEIELLARCKVMPEYKTAGKKYTHIKFKVARLKAIEESMQEELFIDTEGLPEVVAELVKRGVHRNKAMRIWSNGAKGVKARNKSQGTFEEYLWEKIDLLDVQSAKENIPNKGGWLVSAIENDYAHPKYQKRKRLDGIRKEIDRLKEEGKKVSEEQHQRDYEILEPLLADGEVLENAFQEFQHSGVLQEKWKEYAEHTEETLKEALKNDDWFASGVKMIVRSQYESKFEEINSYQERIGEIESQIQQLEAKLRQ